MIHWTQCYTLNNIDSGELLRDVMLCLVSCAELVLLVTNNMQYSNISELKICSSLILFPIGCRRFFIHKHNRKCYSEDKAVTIYLPILLLANITSSACVLLQKLAISI